MKEIKQPDITAPRFRPDVYSVLNNQFFDKFKKKYPKYKTIDNSTLRKVGKTFNQLIYQTVIDTRDGIQLPESIGWIFIGTCQESKKKNIDFAKSHKYGVIVTNRNWETDGKLAKIFFSNYTQKHKIKNREFWSFTACREFKRTVAKTYPINWNIYIVVDATKKLNMIYQNAMYKEYKTKETKKALESYNDFDI
jgi:hypothetical protein